MNKKMLIDYAKLLVNKGISVKKDDEVWIISQLDQPDFVRMIVKECYLSGAKNVRIRWNDQKIDKLSYTYKTTKELRNHPYYTKAELRYMAEHCPCYLLLLSEDPDGLKGIDQKKFARANASRMKLIKPYYDKTEGKQKWCIAAVPSIDWAKKVFPTLNEKKAVEKLWAAILSTSRVDGKDAIKNWDVHNQFVKDKCKLLNQYRFKNLTYHSSNGTNLKVELIDEGVWHGGLSKTDNGESYNPNIPSEEVFTSPFAGKAEGIVYSSLPLSYNGELVEDFYIRFSNGEVTEVKARKNQKVLEHIISMDKGAKRLGEVALVAYNSPINNTGILFYNTLFDENAVCHLALGKGFKECLENGLKLSDDETKKKGINDSLIHVDFMIGTKDLSIIGEDKNGKKITIFKDGNWAI